MNAFVKFFLLLNLFRNAYSFCPVQLTISSNSSSLKEATLIINWDPDCIELPLKVKIYSENPYLKETPALNEFYIKDFKSGRIDTKIGLESLKLPTQWDLKTYQDKSISDVDINRNDETCLNYFVLCFNRTNHVINFNCLKINPQWMTNTKEFLSFPLKSLLIPGTKYSGCYATERNSRRKHVNNESFHQNMDVWHQLVFGIRYLEFSVGYFRSFHKSLDVSGRFWIFNENHEISPIFSILEDVLSFAEVSKEIIILDFRNFTYGFHESSGAHDIFKKLLYNMFSHIAVMNNGRDDVKSYDFTIEKMKSISKYILILYNHGDLSVKTEQNETVLWPAWERNEIETNENVAKVMSTELSTKYRNDKNNGWILTASYVKGNTDNINSYIALTLTGSWNSKMNVISLDYFFSTNLIDICLAVNHQKALTRRNFVVIDV